MRRRDNPFELVLPFQVHGQASVAFERLGRSGSLLDNRGVLQMAHQDFRGLVTVDDPAEPGETVHLFAVNLGPVDRPVSTGDAGPSGPPARVLAPVECAFNVQDPRRVELPFVGLAGGAVGLYQIDLTVPDDWPEGVTFVRCSIGSFFDQANFAVGPRR